MSYLDRICAANRHDPGAFVPFSIAGVRLGRSKHSFAKILRRWPAVFAVDDCGIHLASPLAASTTPPAARTEAVHEVIVQLRAEGVITGWRGEMYPVTSAWREPAKMLMERAAIPYFGVRGFGVHMNGFVGAGDDLHMWVARRARDKPTSPGKLDQLVAGGQPADLGLKCNLVKECAEEADIPRSLAMRAVPVGAITYALETSYGFRPDVLFNFDLALPDDFTPVNTDGEVEAFYLWPMQRVLDTLQDTDEFKFNCALVAIDFAIRHGLIPPDHPDYVEILRGLHGSAAAGW